MKKLILVLLWICFLHLIAVHSYAQALRHVVTNPINLNYRFQPDIPSRREAANPVIEYFKGYYYLFASKSGGYWRSKDLAEWAYIPCKSIATIEDYAPAVLALGDTLYSTASSGNTKIYKNSHPEVDHCGTDWNKTWKIGVATSKYPVKGFKVQDYIEGLGDAFAMIYPCVFVDDDGQAYFYYGGGGKCMGAKLKDSMTEIAEPLRPMEGLKDFHEASWVHKRNRIYYLSYADNNRGANRLNYAMSEAPLGPWKYQGIYLQPTGCDTSHGSIVEYKGEWYASYHNSSISKRGNLHSICVDKLYYNPDGMIKMVEQHK